MWSLKELLTGLDSDRPTDSDATVTAAGTQQQKSMQQPDKIPCLSICMGI